MGLLIGIIDGGDTHGLFLDCKLLDNISAHVNLHFSVLRGSEFLAVASRFILKFVQKIGDDKFIISIIFQI